MNRKQAQLILDIADKVEAMNERFNFAHWVGEDYQGDAQLSCGTTACAIGWGTTIPSLRKLGLRLSRGACARPYIIRRNGRPQIHGIEEISKYLFGVNQHDARMLFIPDAGFGDGKLSGKDWAKQAREYVLSVFVRETPYKSLPW